ncbi:MULTISPECIES: DNA topoisomerase IB [unclassified Streptomyces]|uniref:DNA topoisomerase IB n=1 Tax=unclassified Streptomyces TaxID=2593676 RepID=UPI0005ED2836|nr:MULTISPECIES: DNA topoisomerase IB [unclassified Streptomyces]APU38658.1 DNA topoisomerase [Streptomyces sp. TN58]KJK52602.1 DNA topoisomerase [Streptomyces sp. NRRL F-4428]
MAVRLRTSDPHGPGWRRVRHGRGFRYLDADGRALPAADRERVRALVIPPAWRDVWVCPWPNGHIQAVGTDAAGRRQYLYHPRFREQQDAAKHEHVQRVARSLPRLREGVARDLAGRGLTRVRVLACLTRLLDLGFLRIGGEGYARDNGSFGLTTLLREHAACRGGEIRLHFPAKSGKEVRRTLVDEQAHAVIRALLRRSGDGKRLFVYWEHAAWHEVRAEDLNAYLRDRSGQDVTAKDFRTWYATVLAAVALAVSQSTADASRARRGRVVARAVREVSEYLGNTPSVCRASYIHPRVIELYEDGETIAAALGELGEEGVFGRPATQGRVERAVLRLLRSDTA